jgi:hypothetical protein
MWLPQVVLVFAAQQLIADGLTGFRALATCGRWTSRAQIIL